jgi:hypothetical protein
MASGLPASNSMRMHLVLHRWIVTPSLVVLSRRSSGRYWSMTMWLFMVCRRSGLKT